MDVQRRNTSDTLTRFLALSEDAKKKFIENFGDDIVVYIHVHRDVADELAQQIEGWGLEVG